MAQRDSRDVPIVEDDELWSVLKSARKVAVEREFNESR